MCAFPSGLKIQSPQLKGSRGFSRNLVEEVALDVETSPLKLSIVFLFAERGQGK